MKTVIVPVKWLSVAATLFLPVFFSCAALAAGPDKTPAPNAADRADIVTIDRQGAGFIKRTKAGVTFLHDMHTTKLGAEAADCAACHGRTARDFFDWKMKGTTGLNETALRDAYHDACLSCHKKRTSEGKGAGPSVRDNNCARCHADKLPFKSAAMQVRMPLPLHSLHNTSPRIPPLAGQEKNCSNCHHTVVDKDSGALLLEKGKEQPCFTCHLQKKKENTPPAREAAHQTCLTCHVRLNMEGKAAGPSNCSTCHAVPLSRERKYSDGPRLERGQPDLAFIFAKSAQGEPLPGRMMAPALFNHASHEGVNNQCSACHHQRVDSCGKCHTINGEARADFITLYRTGHTDDPRAVVRLVREHADNALWSKGRTCTGCHRVTAMKTMDCAGCHRSATAVKTSPDNCLVCHVPFRPDAGTREGAGRLAAMPDENRSTLAMEAYRMRKTRETTQDFADIPEEVRISVLSAEYKPVLFQHRRLVKGLLQKAQESPLARAFHQGDLRMCASCHHNSTPSLSPPSCGSCHPRENPPAAARRTTLKAAYHQRCMSCHDSMQVKTPANTDCAGCHALRRPPEAERPNLEPASPAALVISGPGPAGAS
ncbi:MAG: cytochrome c family protein [Deltaproteobacteria bacterium]|jgi:hypothetical protein|nr:cytochrome c family protein [Deltaproteobacteria bacterium]